MENLRTKETLLTTRCVKLVGKKEFAATALDPKYEIYVVHVASLSFTTLASLNIHPFRRSQISSLIAAKAPTKVLAEYTDFADVFSPGLVSDLSKHSKINDHTIEQVHGCQQLPYGPIYSLGPIELENLKTYIETNIANKFIRLFKSPVGAPILFN